MSPKTSGPLGRSHARRRRLPRNQRVRVPLVHENLCEVPAIEQLSAELAQYELVTLVGEGLPGDLSADLPIDYCHDPSSKALTLAHPNTSSPRRFWG
jgi:hypothetical protein